MKLDLETIELKSGSHAKPEDGMCVMEAVAYFTGEKFSDHPACVCPTLGTFLRNWNDSVDDATRQKLKPYVSRVVGTAGDGNEERRAWMCLDWLSRECTPAFLELAKLQEHADALRALPEIVDRESLKSAQPKLNAAQKASAAAWDAARDAAWDAARVAAWDAAGNAARVAAWDAAGDAAWDAAGNAARVAAWDAAGDAAGDAARDAAWAAAWVAARAAARDAAWDAARVAAWVAAWVAAGAAAWDAARVALQPVVDRLQASALLLLDRLTDLPTEAKS